MMDSHTLEWEMSQIVVVDIPSQLLEFLLLDGKQAKEVLKEKEAEVVVLVLRELKLKRMMLLVLCCFWKSKLSKPLKKESHSKTCFCFCQYNQCQTNSLPIKTE